jgi:chromosome partitioning protein
MQSSPRVLAFLAQKGGSGKTTLAVHVAVAAQADGERVVILDTDPQGSAATWATSRENAFPKVLKVSPAQVPAVLEAAKEEGITFIVIDTAPHAAPGAARAIERADYILIPCRPTALDLATVGTSIALARASRKGAPPQGFGIVLNACPARAPEVPEAHAVIGNRHGIAPLSAVIGDRRTLARAIATGRAATEFAPKGEAAREIRALWRHIKETLS